MGVAEAAHRLAVSEDRLRTWEDGSSQPTVKQLRKAANLYRQSFAAFYLPKPPEVFRPPLRDYRRLDAEDYGGISSDLSIDVRLALDRRDICLELLQSRGEQPREFAAKTTLRTNPESLGEKVREFLAVTFAEQRSWRQPRVAFNRWREALEQQAILVFQSTRVPLSYMRGYSVAKSPLPVIVVNRKDAPNGRIFTMLHELGHLMLHGSGLCDLDVRPDRPAHEQKTEVFCNGLAGATLVPQGMLLAHPLVSKHTSMQWDMSDLQELAREFSVSREVVLRRLLTFERTTQSFYEEIRREFQRQYESRPRTRGGPSPPVNAVSVAGKPFTRAVLDAFYSDRLTSTEVSDYLGIKLKHLDKVEEAASA
jgi:Zn-dependent peptidase ImmA (M78 family)